MAWSRRKDPSQSLREALAIRAACRLFEFGLKDKPERFWMCSLVAKNDIRVSRAFIKDDFTVKLNGGKYKEYNALLPWFISKSEGIHYF